MKKILSLILILALIIPVFATAAERDPIIGCWYLYFDKESVPEMAGAFDNSDLVLTMFICGSDGIIHFCAFREKDGTGETEYSVGGKWEISGSKYQVSIIGIGSGESYIEDDYLYINVSDSPKYYMRLRKLYLFDPYSDYIFK
jgi:hypothetical protein